MRDYVHVNDVAQAHLLALRGLKAGGTASVFNCGYGRGVSVREVSSAVERASGRPLPVRIEGRRAGDAAAVVADNRAIKDALGWRPRLDDLDVIVASALAWERRSANALVQARQRA